MAKKAKALTTAPSISPMEPSIPAYVPGSIIHIRGERGGNLCGGSGRGKEVEVAFAHEHPAACAPCLEKLPEARKTQQRFQGILTPGAA